MADARTRLLVEANAVCAVHQSGIGHAVQGLITALARDERARARYRLELIVPLRGAEQLRRRQLGSVPRVTMPLPLRGYDRWSALRVIPPLDVLLGRGVYVFPNFGNWPLLRSPSLTFVHDLAFMRHPETVEARTRARLRDNAPRWAQRTDLVVTPSAFSKREVVECLRVPESRVAVVPWGVDTGWFSPRGASEIQVLLRSLSLPHDPVLYVGNIEPRKNLARLVRAYGRLDASLKRRHPLVLAGSSSWNSTTIDTAIAVAQERGDPVVRLRSRISDADLPVLLSAAVMLAHPALYEGFGLVPLQAMASGTPVLVTDRSAMPEVVGPAGAYVDPEDEDAIAAQLTRMLTDAELRASLVAAGLQRAAQFPWRRTVTELLRAMRSVER
jgi:alpha-1,3-rhamnosyl/mannosyltransferase